VITNVPANITTNASSPAGAAVIYSNPTATSAVGPITVTCAPASGSVFAIGTTTVTCTAPDGLGHTSQASFTVTVKSAAAMLNDLSTVTAAVSASVPGNGFSSKVNSALTSLASGNKTSAKNQLKALINEAQAQSGKKLTTAQANAIIALATQIQAAIGN
jgi:hypothetical protein